MAHRSEHPRHRFWARSLVFWSSVIVAGLAVGFYSGFFRQYELVPQAIFMAVSLLAGIWTEAFLAGRGGTSGPLAVIAGMAGCFLALILSVPVLARGYSDHDLAVTAREVGADQTVCLINYSQSFPWVLKTPVPVVDTQGELASDKRLSPALFWNIETFWTHWNSTEHVVAFVKKSNMDLFLASGVKNPMMLDQNRKSLVIANFIPSKEKR